MKWLSLLFLFASIYNFVLAYVYNQNRKKERDGKASKLWSWHISKLLLSGFIAGAFAIILAFFR